MSGLNHEHMLHSLFGCVYGDVRMDVRRLSLLLTRAGRRRRGALVRDVDAADGAVRGSVGLFSTTQR